MSPMWRKEAVPENDIDVGAPENPHLEIQFMTGDTFASGI